jgi:tetrahydromethanopterin S-methyltransferase subunit C
MHNVPTYHKVIPLLPLYFSRIVKTVPDRSVFRLCVDAQYRHSWVPNTVFNKSNSTYTYWLLLIIMKSIKKPLFTSLCPKRSHHKTLQLKLYSIQLLTLIFNIMGCEILFLYYCIYLLRNKFHIPREHDPYYSSVVPFVKISKLVNWKP